ncbi:MAG: hypothetical protein ACTSSG_14875 [Candidatus Heimdallarchaeaceae archaeon]
MLIKDPIFTCKSRYRSKNEIKLAFFSWKILPIKKERASKFRKTLPALEVIAKVAMAETRNF